MTTGSTIRLGALMLAVQPLYVLTELLVATTTTAPYSLLDNTISDLGATTCTAIEYPFGPVPVCSPWHLVINSSVVVFRLLLAVGALLLGGWLPPAPAATTSVVLWVVAGSSSIATGLVPHDQDWRLHAIVSLPAFVAQPLALLTTALALRHHTLAGSALAVGIASLAGTVAYLGRPLSADLGGLLERLAIWPCYLWPPLLAVTVLRSSSQARPLTSLSREPR